MEWRNLFTDLLESSMLSKSTLSCFSRVIFDMLSEIISMLLEVKNLLFLQEYNYLVNLLIFLLQAQF